MRIIPTSGQPYTIVLISAEGKEKEFKETKTAIICYDYVHRKSQSLPIDIELNDFNKIIFVKLI